MYNFISGILVQKTPTYAVVEVNGVGYEIKISLNTYSLLQENESCKLFTYLYVKEDALTLFGFLDPKEKTLFLKLISVSGIGPSTGLMILSSLSTEEIVNAISTENVAVIQSVKGIGAKTAQRVILELKDKIGKEDGLLIVPSNIATSKLETKADTQEALEALIALGINKSTAEKSLAAITKKHGSQLSVEELIKLTLKNR